MNTTDTIQFTDKLMAGLQGFVTLVNDPHQIKAFYDLHEALQQTQPMRSFEHYMLSIPEIAQLVEERYTPPASSLKQSGVTTFCVPRARVMTLRSGERRASEWLIRPMRTCSSTRE